MSTNGFSKRILTAIYSHHRRFEYDEAPYSVYTKYENENL